MAHHRITEYSQLEGIHEDQSPTLKGMAHIWTDPMTLALSAPCSDQLNQSQRCYFLNFASIRKKPATNNLISYQSNRLPSYLH